MTTYVVWNGETIPRTRLVYVVVEINGNHELLNLDGRVLFDITDLRDARIPVFPSTWKSYKKFAVRIARSVPAGFDYGPTHGVVYNDANNRRSTSNVLSSAVNRLTMKGYDIGDTYLSDEDEVIQFTKEPAIDVSAPISRPASGLSLCLRITPCSLAPSPCMVPLNTPENSIHLDRPRRLTEATEVSSCAEEVRAIIGSVDSGEFESYGRRF